MRHGGIPFVPELSGPSDDEAAVNEFPESMATFDALEREMLQRDLKAARFIAVLLERNGTALDVDYENERIPAGYTYLGQLITHDMTFSSGIPSMGSPGGFGFRNYNSAVLDLDCIYRGGPQTSPLLYSVEDRLKPHSRWKLRLGYTTPLQHSDFDWSELEDFGRFSVEGGVSNLPAYAEINGPAGKCPHLETAVGDLRNEDNLILSQLTVLFHKLHNYYASILQRDYRINRYEFGFMCARYLTTKTYHNIIKYDYLQRILNSGVHSRYLKGGVQQELPLSSHFFKKGAETVLPPEFTKAAMRFGHVMIRSRYRFNEKNHRSPINFLMKFNSEGNSPVTRVPLKSNWIIDWSQFFPQLSPDGSVAPGQDYIASRRIAPAISGYLTSNPSAISDDALQGGDVSQDMRKSGLMFLDMVRGIRGHVATGQDLSERLFGGHTISGDQVRAKMLQLLEKAANGAASAEDVGFVDALSKRTPLLLYLLIEADLTEAGACLGKLGSTVLAEVILQALQQSSGSLDEMISEFRADFLTEIPLPRTMPDILNLLSATVA